MTFSNIPDELHYEKEADKVRFTFNGLSTGWMGLDDPFIKRIDEDNLKFNDNSSLEDDYFIIVDKDFEELIAEYHELDTDFIDENNDEYTSFMIDNAFNPISVKCLSKYELFCDIASDYGISIKKEDEEYKIRFGHRQFTSAGPCMGPPKFYEFTEFGDPAGEESLDNPLNQLMILLMEKVIVFDE